MNVCAERLRRACHVNTGEGVGEDVAQAWTIEMSSVKWTGAQGGLDMQSEEVLRDVTVWLGEFDCLWLQRRPRHEIEVGPTTGALRRLAGDLGVPLDDFGDDSGSEWDEAGPSRSGRFLDENDTGWGHGHGSKRVMRRVDFTAAFDLFGVSVTEVLGTGMGGVGTGGPLPAPGNGRVVQVVPALPQTPRCASPVGGEGWGTGAAVEDMDMGGTNCGGVVPTSGEEGDGCGCDCRGVLAEVWREMALQVRRLREEVMGALGLPLAVRGLGTWEEGRRLENIHGRLERERVVAQREHEVLKVAEKVSAETESRVTKEREAALEVEAAAKRLEEEDVAHAERLVALRRNLHIAAESVRGAKTDAERSAGCEAVAIVHEEVKRAEALAPVSPDVEAAGPRSPLVGVVTRNVEVVTRLNGPVGHARTAELKGVVGKVQPLEDKGAIPHG